MDAVRTVIGRARVHAALGDPSRLAVVDRLVLSDVSPGELAEVLELPTNLIAHHLKVLEHAGVVERVRSEGDRRRAYVRLLPGALAGLAPPQVGSAPRLVFVCTHNSARSKLAAAVWAQVSDLPTTSAGTRPAGKVHPGAVAVARRRRLPMPPERPSHVASVLRPDDLVVAVCDNAHEELGARAPTRLHWSIPDPVRTGSVDAFDHAFRLIEDRVARLAAALPNPQEAP